MKYDQGDTQCRTHYKTISVNDRSQLAYLKHPTSNYHPNQLTPLFEPVLVGITQDAGQREYKQGWWIVGRPVCNSQQTD